MHTHATSVGSEAAESTGSHAPDYWGSENKSNRNCHTMRGERGEEKGGGRETSVRRGERVSACERWVGQERQN